MVKYALGGLMVFTLVAARCVAADAGLALSLIGALPDERPMNVYLAFKGDQPVGFALTPTYNKSVHAVDASKLKFDGDALSGTLLVTIKPDGYVPKDGKDIACSFELQGAVKDGAVTGAFAGKFGAEEKKGTIKGEVAGAVAQPMHVSLDLNAAVGGKGEKPSRARISFTVKDGKAFSPVFWPAGSIVDTSLAAEIVSSDIAVKDGTLGGSFKVNITPQGSQKPTLYTVELAGNAIGSAAGGTTRTLEGDRDVCRGAFQGKIDPAPAPQPGEALYQLILHGTPDGTYVHLYLQTRGGRIAQAYAATPDWNNATHDVDLGDLALSGNRLSGSIKMVVNPDPWIPKDHKTRDAAFKIDATVDAWQISGTYAGQFAGADVKGNISGEISAPPAPFTPDRVTLKIENGLIGGSEWQNRAFLSMQIADGKVTGGGVGNNHSKLKGTMAGGNVSWKNDRFSADVTCTIEPGGNVTPGDYQVKAEGPIIGTMSVGRFQTFRDGKLVKSGVFWASGSPPKGK